MGPIEKSIIATLAYYDTNESPLTFYELWKFCIPSSRFGYEKNIITPGEISKSLTLLKSLNLIEEKNGYFMLIGHSDLYEIRINRKKISDQKWKKATNVFRWFKLIPYVRAIFASGSLASENTDTKSDWDVLIVTKSGRIWTCRLIVSLMMSILGAKRGRYDKIAPDKVCLNHYITDESLHIPFHSLYNAQTYAHLAPVFYDDIKIIEKFKEENKWVGEFINYWHISNSKTYRTIKINLFLLFIKNVAETTLDTKIGQYLELLFKKIQLIRIIRSSVYKKPSGRITVQDNQLEFHPHSPEKEIISQYNSKIQKMNIGLLPEKDSGLIF